MGAIPVGLCMAAAAAYIGSIAFAAVASIGAPEDDYEPPDFDELLKPIDPIVPLDGYPFKGLPKSGVKRKNA